MLSKEISLVIITDISKYLY